MSQPKRKNTRSVEAILEEIPYEFRLANAFGFDSDDLTLNRQGRLSDKQIQRLLKNQRYGEWVLAAISGVFTLTVILIGSGVWNNLQSRVLNTWQASAEKLILIVLIGIIIVILGWFIRSLIKLQKLRQEIRAGVVQSVTGQISLSRQFAGKATQWTLTVDNVKYDAHLAVQLLRNHQVHTLYFLPTSHLVIAVEYMQSI